jgi:hypothetical protein
VALLGGLAGVFGYHPEARHWYAPYTWLPTTADRVETRVLFDEHSSVNNYGDLPTRGAAYYEREYGVGKRLDEQDNPVKRLKWLQQHPAVLTWFQQRVTGYVATIRVADVKTEGPISARGEAVPPTAKRILGKGADDTVTRAEIEGAEEFQFVEDIDSLDNGGEFCVPVVEDRVPIADGFRLNPHLSDKLVQELRNVEANGTTIDRGYLNNPTNMLSWIEKGYLVPERVFQTMETTGLTQHENARFLIAQGANADWLVLMMGEIGEAEWNINKGYRDPFVDGVKAKSGAAAQDLNAPVDEATFDAAVGQTLTEATAAGQVRDTHAEFRFRQTQAELAGYQLSEDSYMTCAVVGNADIKDLLIAIRDSGRYRVVKGREDLYVAMLLQAKSSGGTVSEHDPTGAQPGAKVAADLADGWIEAKSATEDGNGTGTQLTPEEQAALDTFSGKSIKTVLQELVDAIEPNEAKREVITARAAQLVIAELPDTLRGEGIDPDTWTITNATLAVKWLKIRVQDVQKPAGKVVTE